MNPTFVHEEKLLLEHKLVHIIILKIPVLLAFYFPLINTCINLLILVFWAVLQNPTYKFLVMTKCKIEIFAYILTIAL